MKRAELYTFISQITIIVVLAGALAYIFYSRGAWQERKKDLEVQVRITDQLRETYTRDSTVWARSLDALQQQDTVLADTAAQLAEDAVTQEQERVETVAALPGLEAEDLVRGLEIALIKTETSRQTCVASLGVAERRRSLCVRGAKLLLARIDTLEVLRGRLTAERDSAQALLKPPPLLSLTLEGSIGPGCTFGLGGGSMCGVSVQVTVLRFRLPLTR